MPGRSRSYSRSVSHSPARSPHRSPARSVGRSARRLSNHSKSPVRRSRSSGSHSRSQSRSRSRSFTPDDDNRVHVADLGMDCSKREIEECFEKFGPVKEVWLARNPPCFAFVVFKHREDAADAIKEMNGRILCGGRIRVSIARPRTRGRGRRGFDNNMRCYQCGEKGHFSRDCRERGGRYGGGGYRGGRRYSNYNNFDNRSDNRSDNRRRSRDRDNRDSYRDNRDNRDSYRDRDRRSRSRSRGRRY